MSGSESEKKCPDWIDSENFDCQISETCQLYGINVLECSQEKANKKDDGDTDSIISEDSGKDSVPLQDRVNSQLYIVRETEACKPLWKCSLKDNADAIAGHIHAANKLIYRLPCHSFRSMLPPQDGRPPTTSPSWLRCCMRGALFAALQDRLSCHDNNANRLRFPEFVYCWFADSRADESADEDRWAFYHGLGFSSSSNPEIRLIFNLLDDTQGEDYFAFLAHAMENIRKQMINSWEHQFGEVLSCRKAIGNKTELMDAIQKCGHSLGDGQTCTSDNIWISDELCKEVIYQQFCSDMIKSSEYAEELSNKVNEMAMDVESSLLTGASQNETDAFSSSIDLFMFLQMIMEKYLSHKKKQVTLIRLMFETASKGVLTDFYDAPSESNASYQEGLISVPQLYQILKTIWKSVTLKETTLIYRESYDALYPPSQWNKAAPDGINFQSFLIAAERRSLFSKIIMNA